MPRPAALIIVLLVLLLPASALSESLTMSGGQINAWHDGLVKDRAVGSGTIEYAWEGYEVGGSSGFNVSNGKASYFFGAEDYSIELRDFSGEIIAESDPTSTTVDGIGVGTMKAKSYEGARMGVLVSGMPSGEMNANGIWEIHASSTGAAAVPDPMETNESDGNSTKEMSVLQINSSMGFPI